MVFAAVKSYANKKSAELSIIIRYLLHKSTAENTKINQTTDIYICTYIYHQSPWASK